MHSDPNPLLHLRSFLLSTIGENEAYKSQKAIAQTQREQGQDAHVVVIQTVAVLDGQGVNQGGHDFWVADGFLLKQGFHEPAGERQVVEQSTNEFEIIERAQRW